MIHDFKSFNLIDYLGDGIKQLLGIKTEKKPGEKTTTTTTSASGQPDLLIFLLVEHLIKNKSFK